MQSFVLGEFRGEAMRDFSTLLLCWLLAGPLLAGPLQATELVFYNWDEYLSDEVLARFEQETGIHVRQVYFDNDEERDEVLLTDASAGFDLVLIDSFAAEVLGDNQVFVPMPAAQYQAIDTRWRSSCGDFALPYSWGTLGIAYRHDLVSPAPTSWRDILEPLPSLHGHIAWLADQVDTFTPMLKLAGHSINTAERGALQPAFEQLLALGLFGYGYVLTEVKNNPDSPIHMALAYSGDHYTLNAQQPGEHWRFVTPREGSVLWVDCVAVLAGSKHQAEALALLRFLNRPEIAALNASTVWIATANGDALPLVDVELRADRDVYPGAALIEASETYINMDAANSSLRAKMLRALEKSHDAQ